MTYSADDLHVAPGAGEVTESGMTIKFRADDLGGDFSIMEGEVEPDQLLAPHTHEREDQCVFVIEGHLIFEVGGEGGAIVHAGPGSYVKKPRGVSHAFWNKGDETARYIELSGRDGFEKFVDDASENTLKASVTAPKKYGVTFHFERIPALLKAHDLNSVRGGESLPAPIIALLKALPG